MHLHHSIIGKRAVYAIFDVRLCLAETPTQYLNHVARCRIYSPASQRQLAYVLTQFLTYLEDSPYFSGLNVDECISHFNRDHLVNWINAQRRAGIQERTIHSRETLLREAFCYFSTEDARRLVTVSPWSDGRLLTRCRHMTLPRYVTEQQLIHLLLGLKNESQRVAAHFLFDTGVRISELCRLNRESLPDITAWPEQPYYPIHLVGSKGRDGTGMKPRETVISHAMLTRVHKYHRTRAYFGAAKMTADDRHKPAFLSVNGERLTENGFRKALASAAIRQGIDPNTVTPHRLRHGAGFSVLRSDLGLTLLDNLLILRGMLGHKHIATTEAYAHIPLAAILKDRSVIARHIEAQRIYDQTALYPKDEHERRGHTSRLRIGT